MQARWIFPVPKEIVCLRNPKLIVLVALAALLVLPGCALVNSLVEYPTPTPRPQFALRPTFTPTPVPTVEPSPTAEPAAPQELAAQVAGAPEEEAARAPEEAPAPAATPEPPTPTPEPPTATPEPPTPTPEPPTPTPTATPEPKPEAVVSNPRVNVRSGPGADFPVLGQVLQGQRLPIVGRDEDGQWWQICCFEGQPGWLADEVVRAEGPLETVALSPDLPTPTAVPQPTPTAEAAALAQPPAAGGSFPFELVEEAAYPFRHDYLRVGVKANDPDDNPLPGYYLRVVNETTGQQWLSPATGGGPWRGTAPSADFPDFRQANLIFDTRGKSALAGHTFALWLTDGAGRQVSPAVRYTQNDNDFRWLYVVWTRQ